LFSAMPSTIKIAPQRVANCRKLATEFEYYIAKSHSLRKVFVSIKGIYYQADIRGQTITWIVPFKFTQKIGTDVDYRVMLSFLEFHEVCVGFVNFKLYQSLGLNYPPKLSEAISQKGDELEAILDETKEIVGNVLANDGKLLQKKNAEKNETEKQKEESKARLSTLSETLSKIKEPLESSEESIDEGEPDSEDEENASKKGKDEDEDEVLFEGDEINKKRKELSVYENLFLKCHFWLSREVPRESMEFVIKSFGGKVSWDGNGTENDETITHNVVDRDQLVSKRLLTRDYIQPQWIYDSTNARVLIPTDGYQPGAKLPPQLSPFVDDYAEGYVPEYRKKLDQLYKEQYGIPNNANSNPVPIEEDEEESESDEEERFAQDLAAEKEGNYEPSGKKKLRKLAKQTQQADEAEQKETAESLLPRRRRRLLQRIKYSKRMKLQAIAKLEEKKTKISGWKS